MRRAALGVIRIILENNIRLRMQNVVASQIAKISSENQRRATLGLLTNTLRRRDGWPYFEADRRQVRHRGDDRAQ